MGRQSDGAKVIEGQEKRYELGSENKSTKMEIEDESLTRLIENERYLLTSSFQESPDLLFH